MVKLKSHKIKHTTLCDLLSVFIEYRIPAFIKYRIFKSKHLPIAFYFKVEIVIQICFNCSNSSNPHRSSRHCYSYRRQGRPQGAGTPPDTAPYIPIFIFLKTTTPPNGGNSGGVPPPFLPLLLTQR